MFLRSAAWCASVALLIGGCNRPAGSTEAENVAAAARQDFAAAAGGRFAPVSAGVDGVEVAGHRLLDPKEDNAVDADVAGPFAIGGHDLYLVRLISAASACPAQFRVLDVTAQGRQLSRLFGTCDRRARVGVVGPALTIALPRFSNVAPARGEAAWRYEAGRLQGPGAETDVKNDLPDPAPDTRWPGAAAVPLFSGPADAAALDRSDALVAAFERDYPRALVDPSAVDKAPLSPASLDAIVRGLARLSSWPGSDPVVADSAAALFASRRHGDAAFAALARAAQQGSPAERAAAAAFRKQMQARLRPPAS